MAIVQCKADGCSIVGNTTHRLAVDSSHRITKGYCNKHYQRWLKHGDPSVTLSVGEANHNWSGENVTYYGAHQRIKKALGPPGAYQCIADGCMSPAKEWAYNGLDPDQKYEVMRPQRGPLKAFYSVNPEYYEPMCVACHRRKDSAQAAEELREYREWKHRTGLTLADL